MTGFDSKRQASKSLLEPQSAKEVANEQSWDTGLWFVATTASEAHLQAALRRLTVAVEGTHPDPWREAIDNALICTHIGTVDSFPTADQALDALIDWHVAVALDPEVSSAAQALVDRGATQPQAEPVAWRRYNRSIGWQYEDGVTSFASDPSAEPLYAAPQAVAEPLTDGELRECFTGTNTAEPLSEGWPGLERFARAIEAHHGIKGTT